MRNPMLRSTPFLHYRNLLQTFVFSAVRFSDTNKIRFEPDNFFMPGCHRCLGINHPGRATNGIRCVLLIIFHFTWTKVDTGIVSLLDEGLFDCDGRGLIGSFDRKCDFSGRGEVNPPRPLTAPKHFSPQSNSSGQREPYRSSLSPQE